jgi:hypothetical protein
VGEFVASINDPEFLAKADRELPVMFVLPRFPRSYPLYESPEFLRFFVHLNPLAAVIGMTA